MDRGNTGREFNGIHPLFTLVGSFTLVVSIFVLSVFPSTFQTGPGEVFAQTTDGTVGTYSASGPEPLNTSGDGTTGTYSVSAPAVLNQSGDGTVGTYSASAPTPLSGGDGTSTSISPQQLYPLAPATSSQQAPPQVTRTYVGVMCIGNDAWWVWKYSDGSINKIQNFGHQPGECGNPTSQPAPARPQNTTPAVINTSSATTTVYQGGMCNGNDAWWVKKWSDGHIDWVRNFGHQPGECGNPASGSQSQPTTTQTSTATQQSTATHSGTSYPQCGGTVGLEGFASNHTVIVTPVLDSQGNIVRYDHNDQGIRPGQCGNPQVINVVQVAAPVVTSTPTPAPTVTPTPTPTPAPTATPVPTATPTALVTNVTCPAGTTAAMNGSTLVCVSTTPALTSASITTQTSKLPETGGPLAGVSLAGLVPLGFKLKRFNRFTDKGNAQSIWKDRELKSVLK